MLSQIWQVTGNFWHMKTKTEDMFCLKVYDLPHDSNPQLPSLKSNAVIDWLCGWVCPEKKLHEKRNKKKNDKRIKHLLKPNNKCIPFSCDIARAGKFKCLTLNDQHNLVRSYKKMRSLHY